LFDGFDSLLDGFNSFVMTDLPMYDFDSGEIKITYPSRWSNTTSFITTTSTWMKDKEGHLVLELDMPGVKLEDLTVNVANDKLTISGKRGERTIERHVAVPDSHDALKAVATLKNGVLTMRTPPKEEKQKSSRIDVLQG